MWAKFSCFYINSFEHHSELRSRNLDARARPSEVKLEGPAFETFVEEPESVAVPQEQLDAIACAVEEDEDITRERIFKKLLANDGAESVVGFSKVDRLSSQEDPYRCGETQHAEVTAATT